MAKLLDFSAKLIDPKAIKDAGYDGVIGYFSDSRPGANFGAKPLRADYCDRLRALGLEIVTNYQYGKGETSDWKGGYEAGIHHGKIALQRHFEANGPGFRPLYAPVDSNPSLGEWNTFIAPFLKGWASVVGLEWTGVYCNARCIEWALEDGVATWFWQHNWSGDPSINGDHHAAHIHQIEIDKSKVDGTTIDINITLKADYGQWSKAVSPAVMPPVPMIMKPDFVSIDFFGDTHNSRNGARVINGLGHTQEGGPEDGSGAEGLANFCKNPKNQASYHDVIGNGKVFHVVPKNRASWSVLDANRYTNNYCLAGSRADWTREQWLRRENDIRILAWLMVQDAKEIGYSTEVLGTGAFGYQRGEGLADHNYVSRVLGFGNHRDWGFEFPIDVLKKFVLEFAQGVPLAPPVNEIDEKAKVSPWLGERITQGEHVTPDTIGRYAQFEEGYIYWHPQHGAHPIPLSVWTKFAQSGWEAGALGYPITDHTVLNGPDGKPWGDVQGFQNGNVYVKYGHAGYWVHGEIAARWYKQGFENGPLGWPISDEEPYDRGIVQHFENGDIYWGQNTLAMIHRDGADLPLQEFEV